MWFFRALRVINYTERLNDIISHYNSQWCLHVERMDSTRFIRIDYHTRENKNE